MEETIDLKDIFSVLKKRMGMIILTTLLGLGLSGVVTFFIITPKYSSYTQLIVKLPQGGEQASTGVNDVNFNLMMINTYKDFITKSDTVAEEAQKQLVKADKFKGSVADLKGMLEVNQEQNSQMFSIKATATNPYLAKDIANVVTEVFNEKAQDIMAIDKITMISSASVNPNPVSPNKKLNLLIGLLLGMFVGIGIAFLREFLDRTVKDDRFITEELGLSVLGVIPEFSSQEFKNKVKPHASFTSKDDYTPSPVKESLSRVESSRVERRQRQKL
ncbi:YveK family protein [Vagococcus humatus]|uniref:Capsular polysaccharide biosynthesis protein CpsC n=1 Tax=Vagococcus humatus TaxID=1889241 RepID=A0A3R9ZXA7_9ENTE|nr:Wzz/FepE/Etk N-terminal domain-containing protein [Vagococcus humatus]RST89900.1 tyrosine protein kinase [Vagococcus humatus]